MCQKPREEPAVQTVHIFRCIPEVELRLQIQKQMHIPERTRKIKQCNSLSRECGKLHPKIDGYCGSPHPAFGTHHHNHPFEKCLRLDVSLSQKTQQHFLERVRSHGFWHKVLDTTAHCLQQQLRIRRIRGRTGYQSDCWPDFASRSAQRKK